MSKILIADQTTFELVYYQRIEVVPDFISRTKSVISISSTNRWVWTLGLLEKIGLFFPIKVEQILRLNEDKVFDFSKAHDDFGYSPISFEEGIGQEIEAMRLAGLI